MPRILIRCMAIVSLAIEETLSPNTSASWVGVSAFRAAVKDQRQQHLGWLSKEPPKFGPVSAQPPAVFSATCIVCTYCTGRFKRLLCEAHTGWRDIVTDVVRQYHDISVARVISPRVQCHRDSRLLLSNLHI